MWGRAPWNETWGGSDDPEWTAGERGHPWATHAEPARITHRAPEVFPYAHKHAGFSFTAVAEHRPLTKYCPAAKPTTVELDCPPSWAGEVDVRSPTFSDVPPTPPRGGALQNGTLLNATLRQG